MTLRDHGCRNPAWKQRFGLGRPVSLSRFDHEEQLWLTTSRFLGPSITAQRARHRRCCSTQLTDDVAWANGNEGGYVHAYLAGELREDGGLIAKTGTDFENAVVGLDVEQIGH